MAITISIACYTIDKNNIAEAKEWLFNANGMWSDVDIFEDLKDSNGSAEDLQAWFDKEMKGELNHNQALSIIRKEYPELQRAHVINAENTKLIEAFCADDADWHKLLDKRDEGNSTLIDVVIKLADKCNKMQKEIEKPQTYAVGWNGKLVKSDTGEIVNLYEVMEILNKHEVKIK
nr:hypothetical protein [Providencia heimbachae]